MPVNPLPTPPSRADSVNFAARSDAFMAALPAFVADVNALQISTNVQTAADKAASATSAAQAAASAAAAQQAWSAATAPAEQLAAYTGTAHIGTVVAACVYDTRKDFDGGSWRNRCLAKSWATETLGGDRWIGRYATIAAAWTAAGSALGAVFQASATAGPLTIGKYYAATSATTATEVFRGVRASFPALALVIAEANRVVIYDMANGNPAMWLVLNQTTATAPFNQFWRGTRPIPTGATLAALNGQVVFVLPYADATGGIYTLDFAADLMTLRSSSSGAAPVAAGTFAEGIAQRHSATLGTPMPLAVLPGNLAYSVAVAALDDAPINPATGLPVPTVAVSHALGVSVVRQDGVVCNHAFTGISSDAVVANAGVLSYSNGGNQNGHRFIGLTSLPVSFAGTQVGTVPLSGATYLRAPAGRNSLAIQRTSAPQGGWYHGLTLCKVRPDLPAASMRHDVGLGYATGWMVGDIRGAWMCETQAETLTSPELVSNGTFAVDAAGWVPSSPATLAVVSGELQITVTSSAYATTPIATIPGRTYRLQATMRLGTATSVMACAGNTPGSNALATITSSSTSNTTVTLSFIATAATTYPGLQVNGVGTGFFDNISVKLVDADASVKFSPMHVVGSLDKTPVAPGAELMGYSGFTGSSYLQQAYTSNLDFGTGDFSVAAWIRSTATSSNCSVMSRCAGGMDGFHFYKDTTSTGGKMAARLAGNTYLATAGGVMDDAYHQVWARRRDGLLDLWQDGVQVMAATLSTQNISGTNLLAQLGYSTGTPANGVLTGLALVRVSATAPTDEQIRQSYRDEEALFNPNAQCTLAGGHAAQNAITFDAGTGLLHTASDSASSSFSGLVRVASGGTADVLAAGCGVLCLGGTNATVVSDAVIVRERLGTESRQRRKVTQNFDLFSFTAATTSASKTVTASAVVGTPTVGTYVTGTGIPANTYITFISGATYTLSQAATATGTPTLAQSSIPVTPGYTVQTTAANVYANRLPQRQGATKDYIVLDNGHVETVQFAVSPGSAVWVSIEAWEIV